MEINSGAQPENKEGTPTPVLGKYTMTVPLDDAGKTATFQLKEMDEDVFMAAQTMIDKGKDFDAIRMVVKALCVAGDAPELLQGNFIAVQSASFLVKQMLAPIPGSLKKN